jgi:site-specific DNA recombinase
MAGGYQDTLVNALLNGTPAARINDRLAQLEARQKELEAELARSSAPDPIRLHPSMAATYRTRVADLVRSLEDPDRAEEAREALRALIDKVVLTPVPGPGKRPVPRVDLHGALAEILALGLSREKGMVSKARTAEAVAAAECAVFLVAGACNRRRLPGPSCFA